MYDLYNGYGGYGGWSGYGPGSMMGVGGGLLTVAFWVLFAFAIVWFIREARGMSARHGSNALEILKERYAKGEINREQFESMKKDLR